MLWIAVTTLALFSVEGAEWVGGPWGGNLETTCDSGFLLANELPRPVGCVLVESAGIILGVGELRAFGASSPDLEPGNHNHPSEGVPRALLSRGFALWRLFVYIQGHVNCISRYKIGAIGSEDGLVGLREMARSKILSVLPPNLDNPLRISRVQELGYSDLVTPTACGHDSGRCESSAPTSRIR